MQVSGVFIQTAILQVVRLFTGICRAKLLAITLGPAGVGIFAQANSLQSLVLAVGSLSLATGYVQRMRYLSGKYSEDYREQVHGTVFLTVLGCVLALVIGLTPFLGFLEDYTFSGTVAHGFTAIVIWSVPLLALGQIYFEPRLIANENYGDYVKASCAAAVLNVIILWFVLKSGGTWALAMYLVGASFVYCSLMMFFCRKNLGFRALSPKGWRWSHLRPILKVSVALVMTGIAFYGTAVTLRALVLRHLGADYAGYIQVPVVLSGYYAPLLTHVIWNVYHLRLSEAARVARASRILSACFTFVIVLQPLIALWIMTFPGLAVGMIYTREFRHSINTFPLQFVGDFFYFLLTVLSVQVLAQNRIRLYIALWLLYSAVELGAGAYFILYQKLALRSLAAAYLAASLTTLIIFLWPAMGQLWRDSRKEFRSPLLAFTVGLGFLLLQAQLLRVDASLALRLLVSITYTALLGGIVWSRRRPGWTESWREILTGET